MDGESVIEDRDILEWCFTISALGFGVFGFLYATYAAGMFELKPTGPIPPPITKELKVFCRVLFVVLAILTVLSGVVSYTAQAAFPVWVIVFCVVVMTGTCGYLAMTMN
jgi:hypothetical protein